MFLEVKNLYKKYDDKTVLDDVNFTLEKGEILCILGPSGCGKTTILNSIGGFVKINSGKIVLNGEDITNLSPENRGISTVFQSYGLFSHKNVIDNISYGLKFKSSEKTKKINKVREVIEIVGLNGLEKRMIFELSGGQQQRVAIARSLVVDPGLILLDEPFSNLDENLKENMRKEIKRLVNHFDMNTILVTHDQEDAFTIADKVILMNKGKVVQISKPLDLYNNPNSEFSLDFIGKSNKLKSGGFVRPEKISITKEGRHRAVIKEIIFKGSLIEYLIEKEDREVLKFVELNQNQQRKIGDIINIDFEIEDF